ncbi:MAG: DUF4910 domain-containing protein, partial [Candidatus Omnitrophica bacterium]|nr:DUF4910 domain-containing protein [Candidatus Omnitrophota bacterium]
FKKNNLHVVGYSIPVNTDVSLAELQKHLYSIEEQPDAIPYATSYYQERWGFCITHRQRIGLKEGKYRCVIDSELKDGHLSYGECFIPGKTEKEVFLSTYICHPSMANNELSGPAVTTFLVKWVLKNRERYYSYRIIFMPETIGALTYLSKNLAVMRKNVVAGFNVTCVGDERAYSFMPSRKGNTLADKLALNVLRFKHPNFIKYSYLERASDERQYCSPGVDLPLVSVMRSKYAAYPEYHTSLDNLEMVTPKGLEGAFELLKDCLQLLERNKIYRTRCLGEPQLGKRGLYPTLGAGKLGYSYSIRSLLNFLAYADGTNDLIDISDTIGIPPWEIYPIIEKLKENDLIFESSQV